MSQEPNEEQKKIAAYFFEVWLPQIITHAKKDSEIGTYVSLLVMAEDIIGICEPYLDAYNMAKDKD